MGMQVDADLVEHCYGEIIELAGMHAHRIEIGAVSVQPLGQRLGHRRADRVLAAGEQHAGWQVAHAVMCNAQISVNSRRAVSRSISILPSSRSRSSSEPSLCRPRRPMSSASICEGLSFLIAL